MNKRGHLFLLLVVLLPLFSLAVYAAQPAACKIPTAVVSTPEEEAWALKVRDALADNDVTLRIERAPDFVEREAVPVELPAIRSRTPGPDEAGMWDVRTMEPAVPRELPAVVPQAHPGMEARELPAVKPQPAPAQKPYRPANIIDLTSEDMKKLKAAAQKADRDRTQRLRVVQPPVPLGARARELEELVDSNAGRALLKSDPALAKWYRLNRDPWYTHWPPWRSRIKPELLDTDVPQSLLTLQQDERFAEQFMPSLDAIVEMQYDELARVRDTVAAALTPDSDTYYEVKRVADRLDTEMTKRKQQMRKHLKERNRKEIDRLVRYNREKYLTPEQQAAVGPQLGELTDLMLSYNTRSVSNVEEFFEHFPVELVRKNPEKIKTLVQQAQANAGHAFVALSRASEGQRELFLDRLIELHKITGQDLGEGYAVFPVVDLLERPDVVLAFAQKYREATGGMLDLIAGDIARFEKKYGAFASRVQEHLGITHLFRYGKKTYGDRYDFSLLEEVLRNLDPNVNADRPLALFVVNKYDHNGAFRNVGEDIEKLKRTHKVLVFEVDNKDDFFRAIQRAGELHGVDAAGRPKKPIQLFMPTGHGQRTDIQFGREGSRLEIAGKELVSLDDKEQFKRVAPYFGKKSEIVPNACSVGSGWFFQNNMVKMMGRAIPQASVQGGRCPIIPVDVIDVGAGEMKFAFKKPRGEGAAPVLEVERRVDETRGIPVIPPSEFPTVRVPVENFDYDSLQVMNILKISPEAAQTRDVRRIGAAYKAEVGFLDAGQPTPELSKLVDEGVLTPDELEKLRKGAPMVMGGEVEEDVPVLPS